MTVYIFPHVSSVDDEGGQHRSNVIADDKVGNFVEFGRFAIDNHQTSAVSFGQQGKSGGRPDHQGRTDCEKKITVKRELLGAAHFPFRHCLPEGDCRCLDVSTAIRAIGRTLICICELLSHPRQFEPLGAIEA